jgi:hypothetical protein
VTFSFKAGIVELEESVIAREQPVSQQPAVEHRSGGIWFVEKPLPGND